MSQSRTSAGVSEAGRAVGAPPPPRRTGQIASLEDLLIRHIGAALEGAGLTDGRGPVLLFGAGQHTWWLLSAVAEARRAGVAAIVDDAAAAGGEMLGVPVMTPGEALARWGVPRAVVLSTDAWQERMGARAREVFGPAVRVIDLYAGLPPGPYARGAGAFVRGSAELLARPTELCLRRTAAALAPYLKRENIRRVRLVGQAWQTFAVRAELARDGVVAAAEGAAADATVVCDPDLEREPEGYHGPADGPVLTLRTGERPWLDRTGSLLRPGVTTEPMRIAIRHDNLLGDVVLSQGILPERLKREYYPNAHIRFVTTRSAPNRHGSDTTGWCCELVRANPWVDEVTEIEAGAEGRAWAEGCDLAYRIDGSGWIYDHVLDYHAMHAELPPGRTDARVHLTDADRAVARRLLGERSGRPRVAVNMGLIADRFRGWGEEKTAALCELIEEKLGGDVVWIGFVDWRRYRRLRDGERALTVREQAAVLAECDIQVTTQGAGANLSAGVGTQTLSLSGCHPCWREGVAYFNNPYIEDPSRRHVELYRYNGDLRVLTYMKERRPEWRVRPGETARDIQAYAHELWDRESPPGKLPREDRFQRVRSLTVEDVAGVLAAMLRGRATGEPAPGL